LTIRTIGDNKMKKCISAFLIPCFLLNIFGCYSFNEIPREDYPKYIADVQLELNIKLKEGTTIISKEYEHIIVSEPSEFIFGKGDIIDKHKEMKGVGIKLSKAEIDSMYKIYFNDKKSLICLSNRKTYRLCDGNYFYITKDSANGFYVKGTIVETNSNYYGRLDIDEISIQIIELNTENTIWFALGIVAFTGLVIFAIAWATNPPFEGGLKLGGYMD
jgi:hypothetical protein